MANEGTKLFVGNLPSDSTDAELKELFSKFGLVKEVHVMSSARSKHGHACAFVVFSASADVDTAVSSLNGVHRMRKGDATPISVSYARNDDGKKSKGDGRSKGGAATIGGATSAGATAYSAELAAQAYSQAYSQYYAQAAMMAPYVMAAQYGNLQNAATIQAAYAQYGMPMAYAGYPGAAAYGYGLDATADYGDMTSAVLPSLLAQSMAGGVAAVEPAEASHEDTKLFVGGLPPLVTEQEIRMVFGQLGTVKEVHIMQGRSQSGQACAFVVYPDVYSAQLVIRTLNKTTWHAAPDQPPIIVRAADKMGKKTKTKGKQKD
jgi:RNA recognition motif-containing protein